MTHCSFTPEVRLVGKDEFVGAALDLRFATASEAINYATDLQGKWTGCKAGAENRRARETGDPITHKFVNGRAIDIKSGVPQRPMPMKGEAR
jgi:hypothetical protein